MMARMKYAIVKKFDPNKSPQAIITGITAVSGSIDSDHR